MKIGLALGGGGARALAYIGVLKFLEEENIKISYISGTSMGSVVGALYALKPKAAYVEGAIKSQIDRYREEILSLKMYGAHSSVEEKKLFLEKSFRFVKDIYLWNLRIAKPYLVKPRPFFRVFKNLFKNYKFRDCQIPFLCTAVDIIEGQALAIRGGSLFKGIVASCALPGVFPPLRTKYGLLVDGGVLVPLPAAYISNTVNFVIGLSVESNLGSVKNIKNSIDVLFTVDKVRYKKIIDDNKKDADFIIAPGVSRYSWSDFDHIDEIMEAGYKEAKRQKHSFMKALNKARWFSLFGLKRKHYHPHFKFIPA